VPKADKTVTVEAVGVKLRKNAKPSSCKASVIFSKMVLKC